MIAPRQIQVRNSNNEVNFYGNTNCYNGLLRDSWIIKLERVAELLSHHGINNIHVGKHYPLTQSEENLEYEGRTILLDPIHPKLNHVSIDKKSFVIDGYIFHYSKTYDYLEDQEPALIKHNDHVIGHYYKEKELIVSFINFFGPAIAIRRIQKCIQLLTKDLEKLPEPKPLTPEELLNKNKVIFIQFMKDRIKKHSDDVQNDIRSIQNISEQITKHEKNIITNTAAVKGIEEMMGNFEQKIIQRINEVKELPFIKSCDVTSTGITLDYGQINISYKDKKYDIGKIKITVNPNKVLFNNYDKSKGTYVHPHVFKEGNACFGSYSKDVYSLLGQLELKKLCILLRQFLTTYNPGSPATKINLFPEVGKREKKVKPIENPKQTTTTTRLTSIQREEFDNRLRASAVRRMER